MFLKIWGNWTSSNGFGLQEEFDSAAADAREDLGPPSVAHNNLVSYIDNGMGDLALPAGSFRGLMFLAIGTLAREIGPQMVVTQ